MAVKIYISGDAVIVEDESSGDILADEIKNLVYYVPNKLQVNAKIVLIYANGKDFYSTDLPNAKDANLVLFTKTTFREFCNQNLGNVNASDIGADFLIEVGKGNVAGHSIEQLAGRNSSVGQKFEDIWDGGELSDLNYDAQTVNFTVGDTITGATSNSTAIIVSDVDGGVTGVLCIRKITKAFIDNEIITGVLGGSATTNGVDVQIMRQHLPTTGETWELVCENTNDTAAGTGARAILVTFMEENTRLYTTEVVLTNGHTPVTFSSSDAYRFRIAQVISWGSTTNDVFGTTNLGGIIIRDSSSKSIVGYISYDDSVTGDEHGLNRTFSSAYTVEAGFTVFPSLIALNASKNNDTITRSIARLDGSTGWFTIAELSVYQNSFIENIDAPAGLPEKADLKFASKSDNDKVLVNSQAILLIIDNNFL